MDTSPDRSFFGKLGTAVRNRPLLQAVWVLLALVLPAEIFLACDWVWQGWSDGTAAEPYAVMALLGVGAGLVSVLIAPMKPWIRALVALLFVPLTAVDLLPLAQYTWCLFARTYCG